MPDLLTVHAVNHPDKPAVIDDRGHGAIRTATYAELEARSNRLAHVLVDLGVRAGDKIVWCGQNSSGVVEIVNASRKIGSTAVPLNYRLSDDEAAYDIAYRDAEGYLYICDRKKDMIISGGMNIYPAEIEAALEQHPAIYEAAVFGIPSEEWGETVHAVVVRHPDATVDDDGVVEHARRHLAGYKVPRSISWVDELPKTGSGKVLKRELRQPYWADRASNV